MISALTLALGGVISTRKAVAQLPRPPLPAKPDPITYVAPSQAIYLKFAAETEAMLRRDVLDVCFPRTVDREHGGFYYNFARDGQPLKSAGKFSVFQGRMTWIAAL